MHKDREDAAAAVLTELAEQIAGAAPRGWKRAELHGYALGEGSSGHRGFNLNEDVDIHPSLCALHTLLGATERLMIDLELEARGRFRAILSERLDRTDDRGFRYLLDPLRADRLERDEDGEVGRLTVSGRDAGPVRGLSAETRELLVHDAPWVDLGPLRDVPALVKFSIHNCAGLDLSPLQETTVEVLSLATDTIDLSGLHGHPTVCRVVLRSAKPVDLRPLASCPNLHSLDLTDAPATDLSALGQLTNLRYLRMLRPQWQEFLAGQPLPASLAVAELAQEPLKERKFYWSFDKAYEKTRRPTLADALEWASKLTGQATDIITIKGKFKPGSLG